MTRQGCLIVNKLGLHARAAARFVSVASRFPCKVKIGRTPDSLVDGKSIISVMMLAAGKGSRLQLLTEGDQEDKAMNALTELIANFFGEGQ